MSRRIDDLVPTMQEKARAFAAAILGVDVYRSVQVFVEHHIREYNVQSNKYWMVGVRWRMK